MAMVGRATPNQVKYVWAFERRHHGAYSTDTCGDWFKVGLGKQWTSDFIAMAKKWEKEGCPDNAIKQELFTMIREHNPAFVWKDGDEPVGGHPTATPIASKPLLIDSGMSNEDLIKLLADIDQGLGNLVQERFDALVTNPMPEVVISDGDYFKPQIFDEVYLCLSIKKNTLIYGPAGCGKSRLAREMAKALTLDFFAFSFSGGQRYAQVFGGTQMTVDDQGNTITKWVPGELLQKVQTPCLILLDEIFAGDPDLLLGLNALLEDRQIQTPMGLITVHKDCVFLGAANTNGRALSRQYTGAQRSDDSLSDRFVKTQMDYDEDVEANLLKACARQGTVGYFRQSLTTLRQECRSANIAFDPSTRRLISAIQIANAGMDDKRAFEMAFLEDLSNAERAKVQL